MYCNMPINDAYIYIYIYIYILYRVFADILQALDAGDFALLTLLDLSAAFDSVDHPTILERLRISYGINDVVLL